MVKKVAQCLGVVAEDIEGREQAPHLTTIRYMYWWILHRVRKMSIQQVRRETGRSYSYISAGIKHIDDGLEMDDAEVLRLYDRVSELVEQTK